MRGRFARITNTDEYPRSDLLATRGGRRCAPAVLVIVVLLIVSATALPAQSLRNDYFVHQFWAELEATPGAPRPKDAQTNEILKEAQYVFSGMIYGFSFSYTPPDTTRGVAGSFELKPIAEIKWGDPKLKVLDTRIEKNRLIARVLYTLVPYQESWKQGWDSNVYPTATGRGTSRYFLSYDEKMASYREAMKEAIRDYLRQRIYNKPKKVTGELVLRGSPYTIIDAGRYVTTVTVKLRIDKVEPYTVF